MTATTLPPGSGPVTCECQGHRSRCTFGQPHVWIFRGETEQVDCNRCGAYCSGEPAVKCTDLCPDCAGEGKVRLGAGRVVCATCNGRGHRP